MKNCPYCNYRIDGFEDLQGNKDPEDGDSCLCIDCGKVSIFKSGNLWMVNIKTLSKEHQEDINNIRIAWLKSQTIENTKNE